MTVYEKPSANTARTSLSPFAGLANRLYWLVNFGGWTGLCAMVSAPWWMTPEWLVQLATFQWHVDPAYLNGPLHADSVWWARCALLLPGVAGLGAVNQMRHLLMHYRTGLVFNTQAAYNLRGLGWGFATMGLLQVLAPTLAVLAMTGHNPVGQRVLSLAIGYESYTLLVAGALFVLLAHLMLEATRIAQENQEFI